MKLGPGSKLGHYEIRGRLGAGGMGEVYRAHDSRLERDVALKVLPDDFSSDSNSLARFAREARAVAALNHPHIVTIYSTEEADGVRFITMELVEGRTLDEVIPPAGVSFAQFFNISTAIAEALSAAHQKQITHRDLKPANVMVTESGIVKVLDFGLARSAENPGAHGQATFLTQTGTVLGTAPYMSPEQIDARALDHRSDLFSFGIMMYEMVTGSRPFKADSASSLMVSILRDHPRAITETRQDVPAGIAELIARCLEKNPQDRVQSAQELVAELKAQRRVWESGSRATAPGMVKPSAALSQESRFRIGVLPFASRTANSDAEALADGLTDDITAGLARFPYLRVVSRPDAEAAKGRAADARAGAMLGARYLLEGTVRTAGETARVSARLIDTETGSHLWAETYDRQFKAASIFDLQDDLTARMVATVADSDGVLVRSMAANLRERPIDELTLDELVLRFFSFLQTLRREEHALLREGFERALDQQSAHAVAWACLSQLYDQEIALGFNPKPDARARVKRAAERSVDLDPGCYLAWRAIGVCCSFDRDLNGLRMAAERTIELNPLSSTVGFMGLLLSCAGDWDRGLALVRRTIELNPHHAGTFNNVVAIDHYRRGEYEEGLTQVKRANLPNHLVALFLRAAFAGQLGRDAEARAALDGLQRNLPEGKPPESVGQMLNVTLWDQTLIDHFMDGFMKAKALASAPEARVAPSSRIQAPAVQAPSASIAVLPFTDMSAARDQEWFCDGVAEEILNALSQLKGLRVAARASAFSLRGKGDDLKVIAEKLQVTTVLDGSVRREADRLRITVRLSDAANGVQLWSERYDRGMKDIFDVQDEIAKAVAARLRGTMTSEGGTQPHVVRYTENQEAYHLYLRGRHLWNSRFKNALQRARDSFEEAIRLDPNYVLPWAGLADVFAVQCLYGFEREEIANPRALEAADRALATNDQVSEAHRARGLSLLFCGSWNSKEALAAFERSIELDPSNSLAHLWYGWPSAPGREERAIASVRRAQELDPLHPYIHSVAGAIYDFYGRSEEGLRQLERTFEIDPNHLVGLFIAGGIHSRLGQHDAAIRLFQRGIELSGRAPFYLSYYGWALARAGKIDEARAALAELEARANTEYVQYLHLGIVYSALGELDRAFELLALGIEAHNPWIVSLRMPMFENFRKDPRFAEYLRRVGHPDAEGATERR